MHPGEIDSKVIIILDSYAVGYKRLNSFKYLNENIDIEDVLTSHDCINKSNINRWLHRNRIDQTNCPREINMREDDCGVLSAVGILCAALANALQIVYSVKFVD